MGIALGLPNLQANPTFDAQATPDATINYAMFAPLGGTGVSPGVGGGCEVTPDTGMTVSVASGQVAIGGVLYSLGASTVTAGAASAGDRKDLVVARLSGGTVTAVLLPGTAAAIAGFTRNSPVADLAPINPAIVPSTDVPLASLYISGSGSGGANTVTIASGNIMDLTNPVAVLVMTAANESALTLLPWSQFAAAAASANFGSNRGINVAAGLTSTDLPNMSQLGGWIPDPNAWTYVSATSFTVPGNLTAQYYKGTKVTWTDSGGVKYGVVLSSAYASSLTTVTLIPTTDYSLASGSISSPSYSYTHPAGFPSRFAFNPVVSIASCTTTASSTTVTVASGGFPGVVVGMPAQGSGMPAIYASVASISGNTLTLTTGTGVSAGTGTINFGVGGFSTNPSVNVGWWSVENEICTVSFYWAVPGTSNYTITTAILPITSASTVATTVGAVGEDSGTGCATTVAVGGGTNLAVFSKVGGTWTNSGTKSIGGLISYPI